ncbi:hypothetical protein [Dokdonella sp.]|nr:hypothetical protein [Dokdonella sp.]
MTQHTTPCPAPIRATLLGMLCLIGTRSCLRARAEYGFAPD